MNKQDLAQIKKILAIDFGESKVGLAMAETETRIAFALGILKNDAEFWEKLQKIIRENEVDFVIIGKPRWITEKKDRIQNLAEKINKDLEIKVQVVEEMFTSKMAQNNLKEAEKKNIGLDDAEAARIMLEDYLGN
jgi:putative Holliday junction resolvase